MRKYNGYPSVTTVISECYTSKNHFLQKWLKDPNNITIMEASQRFGTSVHAHIERYFRYQSTEYQDNDEYRFFDTHFLPFCEKCDDVLLFEKSLTSNQFQIGGTPDLITKSGIVVDFKTSSKVKHPSSLEGYKMQLAAYTAMMKENYPEWTPTLGLLHIGVRSTDSVQRVEVSLDELRHYFKLFIAYREEFYQKFNF